MQMKSNFTDVWGDCSFSFRRCIHWRFELWEWIHLQEVLHSSTNLVLDWNELLTVGPSFYVSFTFTEDNLDRYDDPVEQNVVCLCWLPRHSFKGLVTVQASIKCPIIYCCHSLCVHYLHTHTLFILPAALSVLIDVRQVRAITCLFSKT